jgi:hypothetical protein
MNTTEEPQWQWKYHTDEKLKIGQVIKMNDPLGKYWSCLVTGKWTGSYPNGEKYTLYHLERLNLLKQICGWRIDYFNQVWRNRKTLRKLWEKFVDAYTLDEFKGEYPPGYFVRDFSQLCLEGKWDFRNWCVKEGLLTSLCVSTKGEKE